MKTYFFVLLVTMLPLLSTAQSVKVFNEIAINDPLEACMGKLESMAGSVELIAIDKPVFPLAENKEDHLICKEVKTPRGTIDRMVFTFGDNQLKYVVARGNVWRVFTEGRTDTAEAYMDYSVYFDDGLFLNRKKDIAWILSPGAIHANLFTWENPLLDDSKDQESISEATTIPEFLAMGARLESMAGPMEENSLFTYKEELDGSDPNAQVQVNCFGVDYLGFPRKVEARFGDNKLNVVWILTGKEEEERIREALLAQFGEPVFVNNDWEIYNNWQVGLRKDKPEVLLMEQEVGLQYKESYFKQ
ncbi:hypothetical protein E7Z59_05580 [Robertkochia marina]|uniref:DUF2092 domain-containing protein n=1 Tax=Robertkochia marina TaxID=1227945 RepID=A0A4V3UYI0_9FLAO|nr:hypothetical protein [Robertkochia marina]THD69798.1 hypothetical protein E7Z59_05580 [Robertkochia marina]TRZ46858.1 hypothetical protein D3A96_04630 [Robertkochia marina]